ncbi:RNA 3'-terminal phosphate cyclase [Comamonas odontotermitis]|uniref:RNA 3'-terminal phosphate cyclase n=1 Tax=Comamonas odontotermitis TaxID=379895 RepID=UPI001CC6840D|nr:RNA 3'-terminal phosphate cyclase [Comamonas odontotermitis]UBB18089.1 RNA 3'-terminal phosphate cyclase [Comamonas odontotermitis]
MSTTSTEWKAVGRDVSRIEPQVEIDGSQGEGGGQILRTALALSVITQRPLAVRNIRAKRPKPGLMRQHLACVHAAQAISDAQVSPVAVGATELHFAPRALRAGQYQFPISGAGSSMLVLQTVLPALLLAKGESEVRLSGGTHNPMAPNYHFVERAFAPLVARLGARVDMELRRFGFYPAGGGEVQVRIVPAVGTLQPFDLLARGDLQHVVAEAVCAAVPKAVAARELDELARLTGWDRSAMQQLPARQHEGPGNILLATLHYTHVTELFSCLGAHGVSSEAVARNLCQQMRDYQKKPEAAVGAHLADQLVLLLALAVWQSGKRAAFSCSEVTEHLRSNMEVIQQFLPLRISIETASAPVVHIAPA